MLLAVLELAERGVLSKNEILYDQMIEAFAAFFDVVRHPGALRWPATLRRQSSSNAVPNAVDRPNPDRAA